MCALKHSSKTAASPEGRPALECGSAAPALPQTCRAQAGPPVTIVRSSLKSRARPAAGHSTRVGTAAFASALGVTFNRRLNARFNAQLNSWLTAQVNAALTAGLNEALTAALKPRVYAVLAATLKARLDAELTPALIVELKSALSP